MRGDETTGGDYVGQVAALRKQPISEDRFHKARAKMIDEAGKRRVAVMVLGVDEQMDVQATGSGITPQVAGLMRQAFKRLDERLALIESGRDPRDMPPDVRPSTVREDF